MLDYGNQHLVIFFYLLFDLIYSTKMIGLDTF